MGEPESVDVFDRCRIYGGTGTINEYAVRDDETTNQALARLGYRYESSTGRIVNNATGKVVYWTPSVSHINVWIAIGCPPNSAEVCEDVSRRVNEARR